jgi:hypothetical protein|tara:strand:+ start:3353 stop:3892 length:540 start_codon:yes stop_codon:yes gene_type:complete
MSVTIKIGKEDKMETIRLEMNIRKAVNGDLMIFDHGDIDIVLSTSGNKLTAFPKDSMNDLVYGAQNRLFAFLRKKGIVVYESIQSGAFCGAMEATLQAPFKESIEVAKLALINLDKFIEEERPYFESLEAIVAMDDSELLHPDKEDSTELGEVPHSVEQGSIRNGMVRDPYSLSYLYTI